MAKNSEEIKENPITWMETMNGNFLNFIQQKCLVTVRYLLKWYSAVRLLLIGHMLAVIYIGTLDKKQKWMSGDLSEIKWVTV